MNITRNEMDENNFIKILWNYEIIFTISVINEKSCLNF
jgi:hypothetical protein